MSELSATSLLAYWSGSEIAANALIFANLAFSLVLGFVVGYERSFHGRAAGMRTYGLVCMASTALTIVSGYSDFWYGGHLHHVDPVPSQVIQGIVTGIGFLGAGVIMKAGFNISGLTTAASIWTASSIGVLVGVGFYAAAVMLALMSAGCMLFAARIEQKLPSHPALAVSLQCDPSVPMSLDVIDTVAANHGYRIARGSLSIALGDTRAQWRFSCVGERGDRILQIAPLVEALRRMEGVQGAEASPSRN
jgi:putative Mg2+ transporter-C (MgtC) family protein